MNYDEKTDKWASILSGFASANNSISELNQGTKDFISYIDNLGGIGGRNVKNIANMFDDVDKAVVKSAQDLKDGKITLDQFKSSTNSASSATSKFSTILKSVAINAGIAFALSTVATIVYDIVTASDRLQASALNLASTFSSTKSDIASYKTQIEDLYKVINDDTSSYEDTYNARQELLSIQDQMIEKFGDEAEAVKLVTDAINGSTEALDTLTELEWQELKNSFDSDTDLKWTEKIANAFSNIDHNGSNFQRMIDEMEDTAISFHIIPEYGNEKYEEFEKKLREDFGAFVITTERDNIIMLSGGLEDVYKQLIDIQFIAQNIGIDNSLLHNLGLQADEAKEKLENYQELYNQHILYDKIFESEDYLESFEKINKAYKDYQDAFSSGNEDSINNAKQSFAEIIHEATDGLTDQSVIDYFNSMYPDLQEVVGSWEFKVKFKAASEDDEDDFEEKIQNAVSKFDTVEDINSYNSKAATEEQKEAYENLELAANKYNLTLEQLLNTLVQLGLIQTQAKNDLLSKLLPSQSGQSAGIDGVFDDIVEGVDADTVTEWVDSLTEEDAILANSKAFEQALKRQKEKLDGAVLSAKDYEIALQSVKDAQNQLSSDSSLPSTITSSVKQIATQLEPQFAKLGEAYKAIFTTKKFTLEDVDNSMLEGLRASFAEIEEEVGVAFDSTELESFFDTLTKGDSTADQVQQAFNDLATSYLYSTDTLANLNEETAEAIEKQLEELGVVNAHEVVYGTLNAETEALALQKQYLALYSNELISVTSAEAIGFLNEAGASETARKYLMLLTAQEQIFSNSDLNVTEKISALQELAQEYGDTALAASVAAKMEQASKSAATGGSYSFQDAFNDAKAEFEAAARTVEIDFSDIGTSGASKAGGDAGDAYHQ